MKSRNSAFLTILLIFIACTRISEKKEIVEPIITPEPEPTLLYGFPIDSMQVHQAKIKWNQTLSVLLEDYNVTPESLYEISWLSKKVHDVRKMKMGSKYTIIYDKDSLQTAAQFIYEPDQRSYVVYNFKDSLYVRKVEKEVVKIEKSIAAEVVSGSSVYQAAIDAGGSGLLVDKLVDVFAWQVDFFRIDAGDRFKVIYEEEQVDGQPVGIGRVIGAYFHHYDKEYYGVYFETGDGKNDYFDENGNSLRKTFLKAPLNYRRISSRFSPRRFHPVLKRYKAHLGTDYAANPGTEIRTVGDGVVLEARYHGGNGNYVKIRHNSNYTTQYLHMRKIQRGIRPGVKVKQGQKIGEVGSTGLANGPHLCFRFWKNGRQVNALTVDLPPSKPISASLLTPFLHQKNVILHKLNLLNFEEKDVLMANVAGQP